MPKMKSHRGAAKRFKKTGTGKFKRHSNFTSHLFKSKSPKRKRQLRQGKIACPSDEKKLKQMLPY
jgi:large subunit ribosomal protein L35